MRILQFGFEVELVPACAGVIPPLKTRRTDVNACPRVCGGDPRRAMEIALATGLSPRVRG